MNAGVAFDLGEFVVRLAEVRQADMQQTLRGVVVAIDAVLPGMSVLGDGEVGGGVSGAGKGETDEKVGNAKVVVVPSEEVVKKMIREMWISFGIAGARETWISKTSDGIEGMGRGARLAQMWCEALQGR